MSVATEQQLLDTQLAFARHLRDPESVPCPGDVPDARAAVYRELFFNNILGALGSAFPVAREIVAETHWEQMARAFWRDHRSHAPEFPKVPAEFLRWFQGRSHAEEWEPDYLLDLMIWEHAELETLLAEDDEPVPGEDVMAGVPVLTRSLRVHAFRYPVQQISLAFQPEQPLEQPVFLACFRNRALDVDFMAVSPAAAWLLEHMAERPLDTGRQHMLALAEALGADPSAVEADAQALLDGFMARGVIVGAQPPP